MFFAFGVHDRLGLYGFNNVAMQAVPLDWAIDNRLVASCNGQLTLLLREEKLGNHGCCTSEIDDAKPKYDPLLPLGTEAVALSVEPYMCP